MMNSNIWDNIGRTVTGAADTVSRKATEVAGVAKLKNQIYSLERDMKRHIVDTARKEILIDEYQGEIDEKKSALS